MSVSTSNVKQTSPGAVSRVLNPLYERRWLIWYFAQRQLSRRYRGSLLGATWLLLGPLLMVVVYTLIFSEIIGLRFRETDSVTNFGLYLYCGLLPFLTFSDTLTKSIMSVRANAGLVKKVVFPLEVLPISASITAVISQMLGFMVLIPLVLFLEGELYWTLLLFPIVLVPQLIFDVGLSLLATVAGVYVPDLRETMRSFTRVMFFVTPILWPPERIPENFRFLVTYNPLAVLVRAYRNLVLNGKPPDWTALLWFSLFAVALLVVGFGLFVRHKRQFADLI